MKLIDAVCNGYFDRVMNLYDTAFPADEKKPWQMILDKRREGFTEIYAIVSDDGEFLGEMIAVKSENIVLLDYFAISPDHRGNGIGSEALKLLFDKYSGSRVVIEIESCYVPCGNSEQRKKRKDFYLRAGMNDDGVRVKLFGVEMELMSFGEAIDFNEYLAFQTSLYGEKFSANIELINKEK